MKGTVLYRLRDGRAPCDQGAAASVRRFPPPENRTANEKGAQTWRSNEPARLCGAAVVLVAQSEHITAFTGTWKLNVAKSRFNPGPPFRSFTL
jgi:hypothetical protein